MKNNRRIDDVEVKKANILHHDVEAGFFEQAHPEGSSFYEKTKVMRGISFIVGSSVARDLCVDVGCGTGFVTSFELGLYGAVVAIDISSGMLDVARKRFSGFGSLNLLVCDAESLPLRDEVADLVSVSSVLHHLPRPSDSLTEISRVLKKGGFLYVAREPNFQRFRRFFDFFDGLIINYLAAFMRRLRVFGPEFPRPNISVEGLDYSKVDVHYSTGFHTETLAKFLRSKSFEVISIHSYHWIYPDSNVGIFQKILTISNLVIEKVPLSKKFGRYVSVIARKLEG